MICACQAELKKDAVPLQDDSDLEKKRREADALLQSMGITPDVPVGRSRRIHSHRTSNASIADNNIML